MSKENLKEVPVKKFVLCVFPLLEMIALEPNSIPLRGGESLRSRSLLGRNKEGTFT